MKNLNTVFLILICLGPVLSFAQVTGFTENFNDNTLTGWHVGSDHLRTFELTESDGVLKINYHRVATSWEWDNFNFTPPQTIDPGSNPKISLRVKSNVATQLTLKPIYANQKDDWLQLDLPADNQWRLYDFTLVNHAATVMQQIYFYLDGGSTVPKSGLVQFDDLKIGSTAVNIVISNVKVTLLDTGKVQLSWDCSLPQNVKYYRIYRSQQNGFNCTRENFLDSTITKQYQDIGLNNETFYYYKITAMDQNNEESFPSAEARIYTYLPKSGPSLFIQRVNRETVKRYEKFEIWFGMENAGYQNPYNPDEVDVRAYFVAPSGKIWEIFGFYDHYQNQNQWKIRFAPNETGLWQYHLIVQALTGRAQTGAATFTVVPSEHPGWIHAAAQNPHYLMHDDGSSYYGVGVYCPWGNTVARFDQLARYDANMFGIWNIMYGGLVGSFGIIENELGRYNQMKCGRIDSLITLSEARDLNIMFCIWPHDLFSNTVWAHQWHQNPYREICNVKDIYQDPTAWEYQKKQYRYLIARFGYSRGWGIWEIINEANGTDAWQAGRQAEAAQWVGKVHQYFQANDPYRHPTTASLSGGQYWPAGYENVDLPNVHVYETGWTPRFSNNPLRSSLWLYHELSQKFWQDFKKPALFGEAGYTDSYGNFPAGSENYTAAYHDALWASWAGGLAITPVWWAYDLMYEKLFQQLQAFKKIISGFDYAHEPLQPLTMAAPACDVFGMGNDQKLFGWLREENGNSVVQKIVRIQVSSDASWRCTWYDTWTGNLVAETFEVSLDSTLTMLVPSPGRITPDLAFFAEISAGGTVPAQLELNASKDYLRTSSGDSITISCLIKDAEGRFCGQANNEIRLEHIGAGKLVGINPAPAQGGKVLFYFKADTVAGLARLVATAAGLTPDTLFIQISNRLIVDNFEIYTSNDALSANWEIRAGTTGTLALDKTIKSEGFQGLKYTYKIGNGATSYSGIIRNLKEGYDAARSFTFWFKGDGSNRTLSIRLRESTGRYGRYDVALTATEGQWFDLPMASFTPSDGMPLNTSKLKEIWFSVLAGNGGNGEGHLYFDELAFKIPGQDPTAISSLTTLPPAFALFQNYPNPFNPATVIRYSLVERSQVRLAIYSITGQMVTELVNGLQNPGDYRVSWTATNVAAGVYFYVLTAANLRLVHKCVLIK